MIEGIGTDIVAVARLAELWERHGERALVRLLAVPEFDDFRAAAHKARFLAKRFAAKEAFAKALGTGIRGPVALNRIAVVHDPAGKPSFSFSEEVAAILARRSLRAHLSISDEYDYAVAYVILERI